MSHQACCTPGMWDEVAFNVDFWLFSHQPKTSNHSIYVQRKSNGQRSHKDVEKEDKRSDVYCSSGTATPCEEREKFCDLYFFAKAQRQSGEMLVKIQFLSMVWWWQWFGVSWWISFLLLPNLERQAYRWICRYLHAVNMQSIIAPDGIISNSFASCPKDNAAICLWN